MTELDAESTTEDVLSTVDTRSDCKVKRGISLSSQKGRDNEWYKPLLIIKTESGINL